MRRRVRTVLAGVSACVLAAVSLVVGTASPAAAFGAETFGCRIAPGTILTWNTSCHNSEPATTYNVGFAVLNTTGTYTYSWTITGSYLYIIEGCTSTSYDCALAEPGGSSDSRVSATVTYTQGTQQATKSAHAVINGYCGTMLC
jgi:hypothetical protein